LGAQDDYGSIRLHHEPLEEVPAVLLSECWNDISAIVAEGSGFDEDWKRKTG